MQVKSQQTEYAAVPEEFVDFFFFVDIREFAPQGQKHWIQHIDIFCELGDYILRHNTDPTRQCVDKNKSSLLHQELVRLLQQTLRTSQCDRQPTRRPPPPPDSSVASDQTQGSAVTQEDVAQVEALLKERDEQIQSLCGHMERLALEKESLQQELKGLKIKVGEINDQLGMLMETIQAKDEVIIKLSQESDEQSGNSCDGSPPPNKDQHEVDILKVQKETLKPDM